MKNKTKRTKHIMASHAPAGEATLVTAVHPHAAAAPGGPPIPSCGSTPEATLAMSIFVALNYDHTMRTHPPWHTSLERTSVVQILNSQVQDARGQNALPIMLGRRVQGMPSPGEKQLLMNNCVLTVSPDPEPNKLEELPERTRVHYLPDYMLELIETACDYLDGQVSCI